MTVPVSRVLLERALELACRELAGWRTYHEYQPKAPSKQDVADVQREFLEKAEGWEGEAA